MRLSPAFAMLVAASTMLLNLRVFWRWAGPQRLTYSLFGDFSRWSASEWLVWLLLASGFGIFIPVPGDQRHRAQRLHLYRGGLFLPGTGDYRILFSVAVGPVDRARHHLFCGVRAAGGGCARVHRGRLRYVDRLPAAQAPQPGSEQPGRFLLSAGSGKRRFKTMNVQVILNEDLPNLGRTGDVVKVRAGYARNYLLPRKLAVEADQKNLRAFEHQKRTAARRREIKRTDALSVKAKIEALALTHAMPAPARRASCSARSPISISNARCARTVSISSGAKFTCPSPSSSSEISRCRSSSIPRLRPA